MIKFAICTTIRSFAFLFFFLILEVTRVFNWYFRNDSKNCQSSIFDDEYCKSNKKTGINENLRTFEIEFIFVYVNFERRLTYKFPVERFYRFGVSFPSRT